MHKNLSRFLSLIIFTIFFAFFSSKVLASGNVTPTYGYTRIPSLGSDSESISIRDVAFDSQGNIYTVGTFYGEVNFNAAGGDGHEDVQTSLLGGSGFITKVNKDGSYAYTKIMPSTFDSIISQIAFDSEDNMLLAGNFWGTTDLDPTEGVDEYTVVPVAFDIFLTKINADGTYAFTNIIGGDEYEYVFTLGIDAHDNIYIGGVFQGTVDFDPTHSSDEHVSNGSTDVYLTKLNPDYSYSYTYTWGGTNEDIINDIKFDSNSNVYYVGYIRDNIVDFDPTDGEDIHDSTIFYTGYLGKISSTGEYLGSYVFDDGVDTVLSSLALDSHDRVYIVGEFYTTMDFDLGSGVDIIATNGNEDAFVTRLNSDLSYDYTYTWGSAGTEIGLGVTVDQFDNVYVNGRTYTSHPIDFDPTLGTDIKTATYSTGTSMFVTRINHDKSYGFTAYFVGSVAEYYSIAFGSKYPLITIDDENNLYVAASVTGAPINYNPFGSDVIELAYPTANTGSLTKFIIPLDQSAPNPSTPTQRNSNDSNDDDKDIKKCESSSPPQTTWIKLKPLVINGTKGMHVTWTQYGADKIRIAIDDGTGSFPWVTDRLTNDGHEFLPNVSSSQQIKIKPINKCKGGNFSPSMSYQTNPWGWHQL